MTLRIRLPLGRQLTLAFGSTVQLAELQDLTALTMPDRDSEEVTVKEAAKAFDASVKKRLDTRAGLGDTAMTAQLQAEVATFHQNRSKFFQMITRRVTQALGGDPADMASVAQRIAHADLCVPIPESLQKPMSSIARIDDTLRRGNERTKEPRR